MGRQAKRYIFTAAIFIMLLLIFMTGGGTQKASAAALSYSDVLTDLKKDKTFNPDIYPAIDDNYSLQVIQIAESTSGELLIYVYQPAANVRKLTATSINMSLSEDFDNDIDEDDGGTHNGDNLDYDNNEGSSEESGNGGGHNGSEGGGGGGGGSQGCSLSLNRSAKSNLFDLTLLNRNGVFAKYKLSYFKVLSDPVRYYNITSIYRPWIKGIDEEADNDNVIEEVAFPVGKLYTATTESGGVVYALPQEFVTITKKYINRIRYNDGYVLDFKVSHLWFDSWYVAFSCDYKIDNLYDVDIIYKQCEGKCGPGIFDKWTYTEPVLQPVVTITDKGELQSPSEGWFGGDKVLRNRIQSVSEFTKSEELKDTTLSSLEGMQWVLRFAETEYESNMLTTSHSSKITSVSLLRLHFKSNGKVYNLGVVDNQQTGGFKPDWGKGPSLWEKFIAFCKELESKTGLSYIFWAIVFIAAAVLLVLGILSIFFRPVRRVFKGIWLVISSPFRFIARIIKRSKARREHRAERQRRKPKTGKKRKGGKGGKK